MKVNGKCFGRKLMLTLAALMVIMIFCSTCVLAEDNVVEGDLTGTVSYKINYTTKVLEISGTGAIPGTNNLPWSNGNTYGGIKLFIEKIIINDGITGIGDEAFSQFTAATELEMPDSVLTIGESAF